MSSPGKNAALKIVRLVENMSDQIKAQQDILLDLVNIVNDAGGVFESDHKPFAGVLLEVDLIMLSMVYVDACKVLGKEARIHRR